MKQDTRGLMSASKAVGLVVGLAVFGLIAAITLPVAVNAISGDTTTTLTQDNQTTYTVNGVINTTVTDVTDGTSATIRLNDTTSTGSTTKTVNVGSAVDYGLSGGTVTVTLESATAGTPDTATVNYTYAKDYAYSGGASALWAVLGLAIILSAFLYVIGLGLSATNRF